MSHGKPVAAEVYYELRLQPGRIQLAVEGELFTFDRGAAAIVQVVVMDGLLVSEKVVAVLEQYEIVAMKAFVERDGRLRLGSGLR